MKEWNACIDERNYLVKNEMYDIKISYLRILKVEIISKIM